MDIQKMSGIPDWNAVRAMQWEISHVLCYLFPVLMGCFFQASLPLAAAGQDYSRWAAFLGREPWLSLGQACIATTAAHV